MASVEQDTLRQRKATDTAPQEVPTAPAPGNSAPVKKDVFGSQGPQGWKRRHQGLLQDQLGRTGRGPLVPSFSVAVRLLLLIRAASAMYNLISDCDEVFNFLEPLHYFRHNEGFQTWELSPEYAIRSWAYVLLHWPLAYLGPMILRVGKRQQFFALRLCLGLFSVLCEAEFYRKIVETVNERVGRYTLCAMAFSAGMWSASVAFLPSSFAMYTTMLAFSYSFHPATSDPTGIKRTYRATFFIALGAIVGWPFSAALGIPFVIEQLFLTGGDVAVGAERPKLTMKRWSTMLGAVSVAACIAIPVYLIDSWAYGRHTFPTLNIILYNLFTPHGPDLYGTSPWWFYLANLFLNFNYLLPFALISLPAMGVTYFVQRRRLGKTQMLPKAGETSPYTLLALRLVPFYLWLGILSTQKHKEERFMYPAYPLLCFNAAVGVYLVKGWAEVVYIKITKSPYQASKSSWFSNFSFLSILIPSLLSMSRILALYHFYSAPLEIARHFQYSTVPSILTSMGYSPKPLPYKPKPGEKITPEWDYSPLANMSNPVTLCYGAEWYRYPGSYLIPEGIDVRWIRTEFDGMMPRRWERSAVKSQGSTKGSGMWPRDETRTARPGRFNGDNKASLEPDTYVSPEDCNYLVAASLPSTSPTSLEPDWTTSPEWTKEYCVPFLDAPGSQWWARLIWVPGDLLEVGRQWGDYCLLKRAQ